jgi:Fe-S-cluster containining protein
MTVDKKRAETLAIKARNSIGKYCYSECNAFCCRKGLILMSAKEAKLLSGKNHKKLEKLTVLTKIDRGRYVLDLGETASGCPSLKESKCTVHKNPERPTACKEFPLFIWKKKGKDIVHLSGRCPAVNAGLFYPSLWKFKLMGYEIDYGKD